MRGALCVATRLYILYLAADESISGWEFLLLIPKSPQSFTDQSTGRAHWFLLPLRNYFFWSLFCRTDNVRESLELAEETHLSHMTAIDSTWNPSLAASFKHVSYEPRTIIQTSDAKRHFLTLTPSRLLLINLTLLCCWKKFCYSFVLPKIYSVREINNFPKRYKLLVFRFMLMLLGKAWIYLPSSQLWVNSRTDWGL